MSKGFSLVELSAIIICGGMALHGAGEQAGMQTINSQVLFAKDRAETYVDAGKYFSHVAYELQKVNER